MASLDTFPDDIVRHILYFLPPEDNLASIQLLSRRFCHLANDTLLWRYYCSSSFTYWSPEHRLQEKLAARASSVDWKKLWLTRQKTNAKAALLLEGVLSSKLGQLKKMQQICLLGYDVKDFLLQQCHVDESAEDFLSRRYYSNSALNSIHRGVAIEEWINCQRAGAVSSRGLDRALGAFDMFVLHDQPQDLDYISRTFDALAKRFRDEHPRLEDMSTRQKAMALVGWLRANNLTGMDDPENNYRNLRNCFIGQALTEEPHASLPIISSAIYCCIAERLGLTAMCCALPGHVHASVFAPPGLTLDGEEPENPDAPRESMYLDPYGSDSEVTVDALRARISEFGWTWSPGTEAFLKATPVPIIVQRTAYNIKASHSRVLSLPEDDPARPGLKRLRAGYPQLDMEAALYASMWADILMKQTSSLDWDADIESFLSQIALAWSEDVWIVEKYLVPLYDQFISSLPHRREQSGWGNPRGILRMLWNLDNRTPTVNRRYTEDIREKVRYKIGQVFRHTRYQYIGIINGWAQMGPRPPPSADTTEPNFNVDVPQNGPGDLPSRPATMYYSCVRHNLDRMRVAQENVQIITDPNLIPDSLFYLAGKFFKRFDRETCTFVSNVKEYYPDD